MIDESKQAINDILRDGNQLLKNGFGDEKLSNDLASINASRHKCENEAPALVAGLEGLAADCKKLNEDIDSVCKKLDGIEDRADSLKHIGTDADTIKEQMDDVKVYITLCFVKGPLSGDYNGAVNHLFLTFLGQMPKYI